MRHSGPMPAKHAALLRFRHSAPARRGTDRWRRQPSRYRALLHRPRASLPPHRRHRCAAIARDSVATPFRHRPDAGRGSSGTRVQRCPNRESPDTRVRVATATRDESPDRARTLARALHAVRRSPWNLARMRAQSLATRAHAHLEAPAGRTHAAYAPRPNAPGIGRLTTQSIRSMLRQVGPPPPVRCNASRRPACRAHRQTARAAHSGHR